MLLWYLNLLTYVISGVSLALVIYWGWDVVKAIYAVAKAEAEEEIRVRKAAKLLETVVEVTEDKKAA